jgi:hypothetical protein
MTARLRDPLAILDRSPGINRLGDRLERDGSFRMLMVSPDFTASRVANIPSRSRRKRAWESRPAYVQTPCLGAFRPLSRVRTRTPSRTRMRVEIDQTR